VRVRLLTEPDEYRDPNRLWVSWNIDRLHMAGVEIMMRAHQGLNHQKSVLLYSQGMSVIGSSNMTSGSAGSSDEHNYFTSKPWMFTWLVGQFERKWNGSAGVAEYAAFQPLPPTAPTLIAPALSAIRQSTTMSLVWDGGPFAHKYDVYFGTTPNPPLVAANLDLGRAETATDRKTFALPQLSPGTTYYWRIVGRTMAERTKSSPIWSFTTATSSDPTTGGLGPGDINLYGSRATIPAGSGWAVVSDATAAGGARIVHPNQNAAKVADPLAAPSHYFELTFNAERGRPYRLWIRGQAQSNNWANDSVFVQFSGSVTEAGGPVYRIGTTSGTQVNLEDCSGCGVAGWGWQDNGWGVGVLGSPIYFETTGTQTIRVQTREDGLSIDQILLSPEKYLTAPPGGLKSDTTIFPERTSGETPPADGLLGPGDVNIHASHALIPAGSSWVVVSDGTAAGGARVVHPNQNGAKLASPLAAPINYFELTFNAEQGRPYRLWIRGRGESNNWANDSVFVQFSGSVTDAGSPVNRIGTTSGDSVNLEDCSGCGLSEWGWQDNGWGVGVLGPLIYFETTGPQTIRVQTREDGLSIDQILLSPERYATAAPGSLKSDTTILPERRQ
jgi:hypothetical protein